MGNNQSSFSSLFDSSNSIEDHRYGGHINVIMNKDNTYVATKLIPCRSKEQLNSMINQIMKRGKLVHKNFSTVKSYDIYQQEDYCSNMTNIKLVFDYYENDLEKQIARRARLEDHFAQDRLCQMFYQIVQCLKYLEQRNCYHGDIKPANIFFDKNGAVKLVDSYFTHLGKSNFELVLSSPTNLSYLSPAQLTNLRKGNYSGSNQNKYKNQVFSLAMTVMQAMILRNSFQCYDLNLLKILQSIIKQRAIEMRTYYSQNLVNLILDMLIIDQTKRPSVTQILNHPALKPYSRKVSLSVNLTQPNIVKNRLANDQPGFFKKSGNKFSRSNSKQLLTPFKNP